MIFGMTGSSYISNKIINGEGGGEGGRDFNIVILGQLNRECLKKIEIKVIQSLIEKWTNDKMVK